VKLAKIRHGELGVKARGDVLQEGRRGRSEEQVGDTVTVFVDREGRVGHGCDEAKLTTVRGEARYQARGACFRPYRDRCNKQTWSGSTKPGGCWH